MAIGNAELICVGVLQISSLQATKKISPGWMAVFCPAAGTPPREGLLVTSLFQANPHPGASTGGCTMPTSEGNLPVTAGHFWGIGAEQILRNRG